jgi:hypothetical protein
MMGDALEAATAPALHVKVLGTYAIESIDVIKDGKFVFQSQPGAESAEFDYTDTAAATGQSWYYVRVIQKDATWRGLARFGLSTRADDARCASLRRMLCY